MNRIMVFITLSDSGIETIKSNPELPKKEMEFVNQSLPYFPYMANIAYHNLNKQF